MNTNNFHRTHDYNSKVKLGNLCLTNWVSFRDGFKPAVLIHTKIFLHVVQNIQMRNNSEHSHAEKSKVACLLL